MTQTAIPFLFMRGGTSRGPYMRRTDLPEDRETLAEALMSLVGAGHTWCIDGIGGGTAVTTKVAMLSPSDDTWADVDYFFAQVGVEERAVDFKPTCGNILVGVGPAAIEMGLVPATGDLTEVKIRAVNTGARVLSKVVTSPEGVVYDGETSVDGVPGRAAPVQLSFMDVVGGATGKLFPTGNRIDVIDGIEVSCLDVAMPMMIARAADFGLTGLESAAEMDANRAFYDRMEPIRIKAGKLMGMGDVTKSVTPKVGLLAAPSQGGTATVRYFMPWKCHPSLAVTGSQCLSACLISPGTVAEGIAKLPDEGPHTMQLEHPMGTLEVVMDYRLSGQGLEVISAGLVRTARKLAAGEVFVPKSVWSGV